VFFQSKIYHAKVVKSSAQVQKWYLYVHKSYLIDTNSISDIMLQIQTVSPLKSTYASSMHFDWKITFWYVLASNLHHIQISAIPPRFDLSANWIDVLSVRLNIWMVLFHYCWNWCIFMSVSWVWLAFTYKVKIGMWVILVSNFWN
jgi:hypothetical protein